MKCSQVKEQIDPHSIFKDCATKGPEIRRQSHNNMAAKCQTQAHSAAVWEWAAEVTQHSANTKHYTDLTTGLYSLRHVL